MILSNLNQIHNTHGWIIGNFDGALIKENFEVGYKIYPSGCGNPVHRHNLCKEINIIIQGNAKFYNNEGQEHVVEAGDIIVIEDKEYSGFVALNDCSLFVIKTQSNLDDKEML